MARGQSLGVGVASLAASLWGLDAVAPAESAKAARGDAEGHTGILVTGVDAGGSFNAVSFD